MSRGDENHIMLADATMHLVKKGYSLEEAIVMVKDSYAVAKKTVDQIFKEVG